MAICDKTGTLTENQLTMRKIYTDGVTLEVKQADDGLPSHNRNQDNRDSKLSTNTILEIREFLSSDRAKNAYDLFTCMSVCHSAIVSSKKNSGFSGGFICDSEDEFTMLNTVKQIGFKFIKRAFPYIFLKVFDQDVRYELKALLPFDPVRKIMSVIVM